MKRISHLFFSSLFAAFILCCAGLLRAQGRSAVVLDSVLKNLDDQAGSFKSLSADVQRTKVTVVVNDKSTDTGSILVHGDKMLLEINPPDQRTVLRTGDSLFVYTPGLKRVEEYNLGKNRALVDEFMLLGFGTRGSQLRESYDVTLAGEPSLDGKKTVELDLIPKTQGVKNQFSKIEIWYDPSTWLPVQQQFFETGSGDYSLVHYSNVVKNPQIPESKFKPHWPKGTEKIKPQG
ncbi:MAG TPA: outer membrane lipoprotein-sorting protein [Candidatus Acidoferrales bacterium]|nr:outer membrane lipoprotein-sorting protein [Candidatus Acidoferrales bacterium]